MMVIALALLANTPMMLPHGLRRYKEDEEVKKRYDAFQRNTRIQLYATVTMGIIGFGFIAIGASRATKK